MFDQSKIFKQRLVCGRLT